MGPGPAALSSARGSHPAELLGSEGVLSPGALPGAGTSGVSVRYGGRHSRIRKAMYAGILWGLTPCTRCGQALELGDQDQVDLDHRPGGGNSEYLGFAHAKCNRAAGGRQAAENAGGQPRLTKACCVCGLAFLGGTSAQVTYGQPACKLAVRRSRKARQSDPANPPPPSGRVW